MTIQHNRVHFKVGKISESSKPCFYIYYHTKHREIFKPANGDEILLASSVVEQPVRTVNDLDFKEGHGKLYDQLSLVFASWGIPFDICKSIAQEAAEDVFMKWVDNDQRPLVLSMTIYRRHSIYYSSEEELMNRAFGISLQEFGRRNYGMVPADIKSLINLECVKVESAKEGIEQEKEAEAEERPESKGKQLTLSCTICLEDLVDYAMRMPCKHMFHRHCIVKWLQQSHYCPLCRFEMPTQEYS